MPAFTINQVAAFVAVAEAGTISGAAERLSMSPSAVSAAVTELERALRAQLLHRQRAKGVRLTPTGELVLRRARVLLHQAGELEADARGEEGGVSGRVRLGCYPSLAPTILPGIMSSFRAEHPAAVLEVQEATQDQLGAGLAAGSLDVAIMYDLDIPESWQRAPFAHLHPTVVLPPDHPLAEGDEEAGIDLRRLAEEPMVLLDAPPSTNHALECCRRAGFAPRVAFRARTYETARAFVGRGLGWTLLLQRPRADVTYEGRPVAVRRVAEPALPEVAVVVVWHPEALPSRATRTFVAHVLETGPDAAKRRES